MAHLDAGAHAYKRLPTIDDGCCCFYAVVCQHNRITAEIRAISQANTCTFSQMATISDCETDISYQCICDQYI